MICYSIGPALHDDVIVADVADHKEKANLGGTLRKVGCVCSG